MALNFSLFKNKNKDKQNIVFDQFGDVNAKWYNLKNNEDYAKAFQEVPELYAIITYAALQFSKGIWRCKNLKDGELINDDPFLKILNKPNPLLSKSEFLQSSFIDYSVFGNAFDFFLTPLMKKPTPENISAVYNLDARYSYPQATGKLFYQTELKDIIEKYVFDVRGTSYDFTVDNVCHFSTNNIDFLNGGYVTGQSPLKVLDWALSNIKAAYEARNVYITKRGAFGIISNNSGEGDMGIQPIEDKTGLERSLSKYGLTKHQSQFIISNSNLKFVPISIPTKDLELYKEVQESVIAVANVFRFPILLLNYLNGSTYSNLEIAHRQLYSDNIIPFAEHYSGEINRSISAYDFGKEYYLDYSHIEALQKDKKLEAEKNEILIRTVISIQQSIKSGYTSYESGLNMLVRFFGLKENEAKDLLGEVKQINE